MSSKQDIIQQGDWGYGDTDGLHAEFEAGYKKFMAKNNQEPTTWMTQKRRKLILKKREEEENHD
jgi:hypothetical protein